MQQQIELVIAQAIKENNLHTKNWDAEPLIVLPEMQQQSQPIHFKIKPQQTGTHHPHQQNGGQTPSQAKLSKAEHQSPWKGSHHENPSQGKNGKYSRDYDSKLPQNTSYYGSVSNSGDTGSSKDSSSHYGSLDSNKYTSSPKESRRLSDRSDSNKQKGNNNYYGPSCDSTSTTSNTSSFDEDSPLSVSQFDKNTSHTDNKKRRRTAEADFIPISRSKKGKHQNHHHANHGLDKSQHTLAKRANRFSGTGGIQDANNAANSVVTGAEKYMGKGMIGGSRRQLDEQDFEKMTVKGTCQVLEKEYLRLTAPPRAELVRPQHILELHLANLKKEYYSSDPAVKNNKRDYFWFCSQLKAIRQDCTVQRIQNTFAVDVYETHAKIALMEGDLNEYNQCQTQLKELYQGLADITEAVQHLEEFLAYRLLYYVFLSTNETYNGGSSDLFHLMLSLTIDQRKHPAIVHALQVREAVAVGDYLQFFRLHNTAPNLGGYLTNHMVATMRLRGLRRMAKAYRPSVELDFLLLQLGFTTSTTFDEGKEWLIKSGCVVDGNQVITKDSVIREADSRKPNSLI